MVTEEQSYYRSVCKISSDDLKRTFTTNGTFQVPSLVAMILPLSHSITCHYSFDMAQQVNNKKFSPFHNYDVLGPLPFQSTPGWPHLFLISRKCAIFGVNCESVPRQVCMLCVCSI